MSFVTSHGPYSPDVGATAVSSECMFICFWLVNNRAFGGTLSLTQSINHHSTLACNASEWHCNCTIYTCIYYRVGQKKTGPFL